MSDPRFAILGPLEVWSGGVLVPVPGARQRALLAILLADAGRVVSAATLADTVWDGAPPEGAEQTLRSYVMRVRRALGVELGGRVVTSPPGYLITADPSELDTAVFADLCSRARDAARAEDWSAAARHLDAALPLWRGDPLADVPAARVLPATTRLTEQWLQARELRAEAALNLGLPDTVLAELRELSAEHPYRERMHWLLLLALYRGGRRGEALAVYQGIARRLRSETGLEPGPELRDLHQRLLADDGALAWRRPEVRDTASGSGTASAEDAAAVVPADDVPGADLAGADVPGAGVPGAGVPGAGGAGPADRPSLARSPIDDLPRDIPDFSGRAAELVTLLAAAEQAPHAVVVEAVNGMAGVGKTALVVRAAHRLAARYPDARLYLDLRGHDPERAPLAPDDALRVLLTTLGVAATRIPEPADERAALWRAEMAGRRCLLVLDNAADSAQVQPLLPGTASGLVLVTSRRRLTGLAGVHTLSLDVLPEADALDLLARIAGAERVAACPAEAREVVRLCGFLPLAVRIAGARLAARPAWTPADLADRLAEARRRLDLLTAEHLAVRASFELGHRSLAGSERPAERLAAAAFRTLGRWPGPDLTAGPAAALLGLAFDDAEDVLESLVDAHLLESRSPGRYRFHDLVRVYAEELAEKGSDTAVGVEGAEQDKVDGADGADDQAGLHALLVWYLNTAMNASDAQTPGLARSLIAAAPADPRFPPRTFPDYESATRWFDAEYANVLAAVDVALRLGARHVAAQLPLTLSWHLQTRSRFTELIELLTARLDDGDPRTVAILHSHLGTANCRLWRFDVADHHFRESLALRRRTGDRRGEGTILVNLGSVADELGDPEQAVAYRLQALPIFRELGDRAGEAVCLVNLGWSHHSAGRLDEALEYSAQALTLYSRLGNVHGEGEALSGLGCFRLAMGHHAEAVGLLEQALAKRREIGDRLLEADTLIDLGAAFDGGGDGDRAVAAWREAQEILVEIGHPRVAEVAGLLEGR
ncbi:AfsR/SARP family transcriptional regulator [Catenulispora subtropica]|uniref:OmpR/PhoB-type domain-containing protein n=1 Tax=Catenulispora subtropica TaxID=450798 RepID=A0ABP5ET20_9ACTN